ncbi:hypothetical protein BDW59DRAFT_166828 [Aspergillus cavernicola]|uniref:Bacteriophage T5 Orf172 DNA-binding domain-containing protein n=1 Tax=Aspergillus cavernicola TaxID=176166 RepID=A0ABR4HIV4_9EURO
MTITASAVMVINPIAAVAVMPQPTLTKDKCDREIDREISRRINKLEDDNPKVSNYLYIYSHKSARGFYKVGYATNWRRIRHQEHCYPGLTTYCFIYCPNAPIFEKQVHDEFSAYRHWHRCEECTTDTHTEWFDARLQDIVDSVNAWSFFARTFYHDDVKIDRNKPITPLPGFSKDPARWRKWARQQASKWMGEISDAPSPEPAEALDEGSPGYFSDSLPELSHGLDTPSTGSKTRTRYDRPTDPTTPTPTGRTQRGKYSLPEPVKIVDMSPTGTAISLLSAVDEFGSSVGEPTPPRSVDPFLSSSHQVGDAALFTGKMDPAEMSKSLRLSKPRAEDGIPRVPFDNRSHSSTPAPKNRRRKGTNQALVQNDISLARFAGVTGEVELPQEGITNLDPNEIAEMLQRVIFA